LPNNRRNSTFSANPRQVEEYRQGILSQILSPEAKDRRTSILTSVIKIKLVKPEKATGIENAVIQAAQNGFLKNKVTEK
jgi:DNA-binding TFAR19-related protein (PDSD5 family)